MKLKRGITFFAVATLAVGLMSTTARCQYFFNRSAFSAGLNPSSAVLADFNGDQRLDLAVTDTYNNTVTILLGLPNGSYATTANYSTGSLPVALVAADFNGDGKIDLAVANENANTVSVLLGNGDGTFQNHVDYPVGNYPLGIVTAWFTAAGYADLAVANWNDSTVSILLNNGNGTFQTQEVVSVATSPQSIATGDFNNDGKADLITASADPGTVSVLLSQGNGSFTRVDSPSGISGPDFTSVIAGKFNSGGNLDAVVSSKDTQQLFLLQGKGDGGFEQPIPLLGPLSFYAPITAMLAADFNHDGKLDLASNGSALILLLGNGDGTFRPPIILPAGEIDAFAGAIDVNRDAILDLIAVDTSVNAAKVLLGPDPIPSSALLPVDVYGPDATAVADFNGDGKLDVAVALVNFPNGEVAVELGRGNGTFEKPIISQLSGDGINNEDFMVSADFNGDGKPDLLILDDYADGFSVLLGNGDGTFQTPVNTPLNYGALSLAAADFSGDGKTDVAVASNGTGGQGSLNILISNGDGTFRNGAQYNVVLYGLIAAGDVNHDGKEDLVLASFGSPVQVFLGNGDGTFQAPISGPSALYSSNNLVLGDFNNDGRLDIVAGTYNGVAFLAGNGNGTFANPVYSNGSLQYCCQLTAGDFNGDGKLDLVTNGAINNNEADIMIGNGDGTFGPLIPYGTAGQLYTGNMVVADFNSDGVDDFALTTQSMFSGSNDISLYLSSPSVNLSQSALNFGTTQVGKTSPPQNIQLSDIGNSTLKFSKVIVTGDFSQNNNCGRERQIGSSCTLQVSFEPKSKGLLVGMLKIYDNASGSPQTVRLTGKGD